MFNLPSSQADSATKVNEHNYSSSRIKTSILRQIAEYIYRITAPLNHIDID